MKKDLITKESDASERILRHLNRAPDLYPKYGSSNVKGARTCSDRLEKPLPRKRKCRDCGARWMAKEVVVLVLK